MGLLSNLGPAITCILAWLLRHSLIKSCAAKALDKLFKRVEERRVPGCCLSLREEFTLWLPQLHAEWLPSRPLECIRLERVGNIHGCRD